MTQLDISFLDNETLYGNTLDCSSGNCLSGLCPIDKFFVFPSCTSENQTMTSPTKCIKVMDDNITKEELATEINNYNSISEFLAARTDLASVIENTDPSYSELCSEVTVNVSAKACNTGMPPTHTGAASEYTCPIQSLFV